MSYNIVYNVFHSNAISMTYLTLSNDSTELLPIGGSCCDSIIYPVTVYDTVCDSVCVTMCDYV